VKETPTTRIPADKAEPRLITGSVVYLISNVLNAAIPFALLPVLTRFLPPAQYGEVAMFQTLLGALGAFVGLNVVGAAVRKYYDSGAEVAERLRNFIAACLQVLIATTLVAFAILWCFRDVLSGWLGIDAKWILWSVGMSAMSTLIQLRLGQWQIRQQPLRYAAFHVSWSIVNVALSLLLVVAMGQGASGRIEAQVSAAVVMTLAALFLLRHDGLLGIWQWQPGYLKEALLFGVPLVPHVAGIFLIASVDRFVINDELGLAAAGVYMVAVQLTSAMGLVFDAINKAYVPWLFERLRRNDAGEKRRIVRNTYIWYAFILAGVGLAFLIGPWIVLLVAGPGYAGAADVIGWLALGQGFGGMYLMVTNYVFYSKRTGLLSVATIVCGLLNVVLLIMLTRKLGIQGAALAFAMSMGLRFALTWWVAQKRHPMPWMQVRAATASLSSST
jgi:O-antigen/teichoic acid export membrane protein